MDPDIKVEHYFFILSLVVGLTFAVTVPPFGVNDETSHFFKAYDVSEGNLIPKNADITVPKNMEPYFKTYTDYPINSNGKMIYDMSGESIITYPPLPYLATALVMKIGDFFNLSALIIMYVCRIINLLIYTTITYFAIKKIPILKHTLLLISVMPRTLSLAASASSDSLTMALSFLVIALFLNLSLNKNSIQTRYIYILSISTLALSLTKPTYALIILLFFIIP
jgi:uncharacterized membrane protein